MLKPLGDRVIVKVMEEKEETVGGLVLATKSQDKPKRAEILAVGQGPRTINGDLVTPSVTVGQVVLLEPLAGIEVKEDEQDLVIIREADILAIVE
ncbi:co-chaperone GroES [Streptococcus cuniculipharyngis]|uniref:Co-chaperonin GroES n=1 Tax=Streptococcus cuniculipharyngis TaxID=1562651 RepID=A0A5C5S913_9STRE|nr:co-chaperone GroES [Streptococcus cuniculipharyngis]TWS96443.1 co-chaperone GroES [Streptococcus cuniculipharyngis]